MLTDDRLVYYSIKCTQFVERILVMVEIIKKNKKIIAHIIRNNHDCDGVDFITPDEYSQQVAYMHHPKGKSIDAHIHNIVHRSVLTTQEVLFIKKGKLRVDFYDEYEDYIESRVLSEGDVLLLVSGGHGFKILEETEMIEVKQGPYAGANDKMRFPSIEEEKLYIIE